MHITVPAGLGANLLDQAKTLVTPYIPALKSAYAAYKGETPLADPNENIVTVPASAVQPPPAPAPSFMSTLPSWVPWAAGGVIALLVLSNLRR